MPSSSPPVLITPGLAVHPRAAWADGLDDPGPLPEEVPGDVRTLVVHHSASSNDYGPDDAATKIRVFHAFHTGPEKGWPDVAYNFFVDRYGGVWEGRAGSLAGPVIGDATAGNQGFTQLVCLIGTFVDEPPPEPAVRALIEVLAWLADRYRIDTTPSATTTFVSRGSNRWPTGATVTVPTITGHRDLSRTECPGDAAYALVTGPLPGLVTARRSPLAP